ncbi:Serine/threonine-protein phosphatase 2A activator 2 [Ascosphaera pollenicola]|nr:Serine/threonine-protein phosphatase 2A activator 2 [Ascosphaera pollenicola]
MGMYERYGPAAGVDLSEAEKKDEATRHHEKSGMSPDEIKQYLKDLDAQSAGDENDKDGKDGDPLETIFKASEPTSGDANPSHEATQHSKEADQNNDQKPTAGDTDDYVNHFDTYSLVKKLEKGGFTEEQAVSIMQGIRGTLDDNLRSAKNELLSKSQIENDSYLFKAASEELRNSIMVARASEIESQRTRRAQLQHELDILAQRLTQDFSGLKDDLKEMFNNQKISTRESQRSIDTAIQELNYQITVSLHSDGKSEVEGLRWILTRRAALAIAISAFMSIIALRYHSYRNARMEKEKQEAKLHAEATETAAKKDESDAPEAVYSEPIG